MKPQIADREKLLLDRARTAVQEIEPRAQIILYGSRARGDAQPDSDWDLLILLEGSVDEPRDAALRERLLDLSIESDASLSPLVYSRQEWRSPRARVLPLHENIDREGLELGVSLRSLPRPRKRRSKAMAQAREELIQRRMNQARDALAAAVLLANAQHWNRCVNSLYYACFYAVSAWLLQQNRSSHRHSGVQRLFNSELSRRGLVSSELRDLYNVLFKARLEADYGDFGQFEADQVRPWLQQAPHFLQRVEELLASPDEGTAAH